MSIRKSNLLTLTAPWIVISSKLAKLIAVAKTIKILKLAFSLLAFSVSILAYGLALGPGFAIGLMAMLTIHEFGHVIALRQKHLPASLPVFIPFVGAAIFMPPIDDRATEAYVAFGGPLVGTIAALICFALWALLGGTSDLLLLTSYFGIYLNLFNMIPVSPLDGGRILQTIGRGFKYIGFALALVLVIKSHQPGMIIILMLLLDSFTFPVYVRPFIGIGLYLEMLVLFGLGYGDYFWADVADSLFGLVFITAQLLIERMRIKRNFSPLQDDRPMPSGFIRLCWLAAYATLLIVLCGTIFLQTRYLAHISTANHPEQRSSDASI